MKTQLEKRAAETYDRLTHPSSNNFLPGLILGLAVGAIAGLLLAPKTGEELMKDLSEGYDDLKGKAAGWINETTEAAKDKIEDLQR